MEKNFGTLVNGTPIYDQNGVHESNLAMYSDITDSNMMKKY